MGTAEAVVTRTDHAIFFEDEFVTNALLTPQEVTAMERDGYRCLRVRDEPGEGLQAFRGGFSRSGYVSRRRGNGGRWDRG